MAEAVPARSLWRGFLSWLKQNSTSAIRSAVIGAVVAWFMNVWLMVVRYNGFQKTQGTVATGQGNLLPGMAFWGIASTVVFMIWGYRRSAGKERFWAEIRAFPKQVRALFTAEGRGGAQKLLWGAAVSLVMSGLVTPAIGAMVGVGILATAPGAIGRTLQGAGMQAFGTVVRKVAPQSGAQASGNQMAVAFLGAGVSLIVAGMISSGVVRIVLGVVAGGAAYALANAQRPPSATSVLLLIAAAIVATDLLDAVAVWANDGGGKECQGIPMSEWLKKCQGATTVLVNGTLGGVTGGAFAPVGDFIGRTGGGTIAPTSPVFKPGNPTFDPTVDDQINRWTKDGLVWDPGELTWRPPRPGEIPPPADLPQDTPIQRTEPRDQIPPSCLDIYDRYVRAQAEALRLQQSIEPLATKYRNAQDHLNRQLAKLTIKTGWDTGSLAGGGIDATHGISKGIAEGAGTGLGQVDNWKAPGTLGAAVAALKERLAAALSRVQLLTDAVMAAGEAVSRIRTTVDNLVQEAKALANRVDELTGISNAARRTIDELQEQLAKVTRYESIAAQREAVYKEMLPLSQRIRNLEGAHQRLIDLDAWAKGKMAEFPKTSQYLKAVEELPRVRAELAQIEAELAQLVKRSPQQIEYNRLTEALQGVNRQLADLGDGASNPKLYQELLEQRRELDFQRMKIGVPDGPDIADPNRYSDLINRKRDLQLRKATLDADVNTTSIPRTWEDAAAQGDPGRYQAWKLEVEGTNPRQAMEAELGPLRTQHDDLAKRIDGLEGQMTELKPELPPGKTSAQLQDDIAKATDDAAKAEDELRTTRTKIDETNAQAEDARRSLSSAESERNAKEVELDAAKREASDVESELNRATEGAGQKQPDGTNPFMYPIRKLGEGFVYLFGSDQSPDEVARILKQCRQSVIDALQAVNDAQTRYDQLIAELKQLRADLEECKSRAGAGSAA